jgi:hypothetical protein
VLTKGCRWVPRLDPGVPGLNFRNVGTHRAWAGCHLRGRQKNKEQFT